MSRPDDSWRPAYWEIIRYDAAHFTTPHANRDAQIYRGLLAPGSGEDLWQGLRSIASGVARQLQAAIRASRRRVRPLHPRPRPYLLLITARAGRYAREEREVTEACAARGLPMVRVLLGSRAVQFDGPGHVSNADILSAADHVRILALWLRESVGMSRWWIGRDRKARSLAAAAIPGIREYYLDLVFARRIDEVYGRPRAVLTLTPWSSTSVAIVDTMKARGVATWATRTQTTIDIDEHLAINTDFLFCKSTWERRIYGRLFRGHGPSLVDGCMLSLPEEYSLEPLALPEPFVLLLGTTRRWNESDDAFRQVCASLEAVASIPGLPVIYRAHPTHAAKPEGAAASAADPAFVAVGDQRRNLELMTRASLVVSAPSTLLYQAILIGAPTVVVHIDPPDEPADEFIDSPLLRIRPEQIGSLQPEVLMAARQRAAEARAWFESNYFLDKGAGYLVDQLLSHDA